MRKQRPWFLLALLPVVVAYTGCSFEDFLFFSGCGGNSMSYLDGRPRPVIAGALNTDNTESGPSVALTPGVPLGDGASRLHAILGYARLGFDGGRDDVLSVGAQFRRTMPSRGETYHPWLGGEAMYLRATTVPEIDGLFGSNNPSASGLAVGAVAAYPVSQKIPLTVIARGGVMRLGEFSMNNSVIASSDTAPYLRVGLDLDLQSMIQKK